MILGSFAIFSSKYRRGALVVSLPIEATKSLELAKISPNQATKSPYSTPLESTAFQGLMSNSSFSHVVDADWSSLNEPRVRAQHLFPTEPFKPRICSWDGMDAVFIEFAGRAAVKRGHRFLPVTSMSRRFFLHGIIIELDDLAFFFFRKLLSSGHRRNLRKLQR